MASSLASGFVGTHSKKRPGTLRCRVWGGGVGGVGRQGLGWRWGRPGEWWCYSSRIAACSHPCF